MTISLQDAAADSESDRKVKSHRRGVGSLEYAAVDAHRILVDRVGTGGKGEKRAMGNYRSWKLVDELLGSREETWLLKSRAEVSRDSASRAGSGQRYWESPHATVVAHRGPADIAGEASRPHEAADFALWERGTSGELKTERSLLEKELQNINRTGLSSSQRPGVTRSSDSRRSPMLPSPPTSAGKLRRTPPAGSGVRSGPMRAIHNITADLPSDDLRRQRPSTSSSVSTSPHSTPSPPPSSTTPPARPSLPSRPRHSTPPQVPGRPSLRRPLSPSTAPRLLRYHVVETPGVLPTLPSPPSSAKPTGARNPRLRKVVVAKDGGSSQHEKSTTTQGRSNKGRREQLGVTSKDGQSE
ncbi:Hypp3639 [Branchiostoma lanceolatum]|uniref:Hypp3639 protein n=1 Tax=Branchiostoma lanceolatum TaxID=7740 RepID=A0A8K0A0G6_BRALA|nr:Hypp3639 [Branchiostoma lanceolatum]